MADRIALMRAGRIVQEGTPAALYYQPVDSFVASFFGEINSLEGVVATEQVSTPFGPVDAKGFADGDAVEVLIRPEALHLSPSEQAANGAGAGFERAVEVMAARLMGRTSLIHLRALDVPEQETHFHARVPGRFLPLENQRLRVELDRSQAFVFPRETD